MKRDSFFRRWCHYFFVSKTDDEEKKKRKENTEALSSSSSSSSSRMKRATSCVFVYLARDWKWRQGSCCFFYPLFFSLFAKFRV